MGFAPANRNFESAVRELLLGMPFLQWLGLSFAHIAPGEVDLVMPLRHEITFDGRAVQAGPIGSLLDFAAGAAAFTLVPEQEMLATSDFTVKLLAPAIGEKFIGRGRVLSKPDRQRCAEPMPRRSKLVGRRLLLRGGYQCAPCLVLRVSGT